jgi:phosphatidylglycerophosphate synthase
LDALFDRYVVLVPPLIPLAYFVIGLLVYAARHAIGRPPAIGGKSKKTQIFSSWWAGFVYWMLAPLENFAIRGRLTPNAVTLASLAGCAVAGVAVATGHFAIATWSYIAAGLLDMVDGRLARATGQQSDAGAFLDSVLDRWGELLVFCGIAWVLQGTWWMLATLLALGGSLMVSYTRARGESLGVLTAGGAMQRPERVILVSAGCLATALVDASATTAGLVPPVLGTALAIVGTLSTLTAIGRLLAGYRMLQNRAPSPRAAAEAEEASDRKSTVPRRAAGPVARVLRLGSLPGGERDAG